MLPNIVQFVNFTAPAPNIITLPYAWMAFKSWFEDNSADPNAWVWPEPMVTDAYTNVDAIMDHLRSQGIPKVICFSQYQWNCLLQDEIARRCKEQWPTVFIVYGGPQQNTKHDIEWFKKYYWVDCVCAEGGYGEPVLTHILDNLAKGTLNISEIPNIRYPGIRRLVQLSSCKINVREFKWSPVLRRHLSYLKKIVAHERQQNGDVFINLLYEGSRGCPYGCAFCEWGLYTNSKVNFKPLELMLDDISILNEVEIDKWHFVDANFGSRDNDVDIVKAILDQKANQMYPRIIDFYSAKNNKKKLIQIQEMLLDAGMPTDMVISVQDQDLGVKNAIDRIDLDWYKTLELYKPLYEKYKPKVAVDLILGLPGSTIDTHYQGYDKTFMLKRAVHPAWLNEVLDLSPENEPDYYNRWEIEIVDNDNQFNILGWLISGLIVRQENIEQMLPIHLSLQSKYRHRVKYAVACKSFNRDDYAEMYMTDRMTYVLDGNDSLYGITRYLWNHLEINPSQFIKALWREFFLDKEYLPYIYDIINNTHKEFRSRLDQQKTTNIEFFQWLGDNKTFFRPDLLFWLAVLLNPLAFYSALERWLEKKNWIDDPLRDLIQFSQQMIKTIDYDPTAGKQVEAQYDWITWLFDPSKEPTNMPVLLKIEDTTFGPVDSTISWHKMDNMGKFSCVMTGISHSIPYSIFFTNFKQVNK